MNATPWYSAKVKPVRVGWYQTKGCDGYMDCGGMHYWNGEYWLLRPYGTALPPLPWRGLTEKAK